MTDRRFRLLSASIFIATALLVFGRSIDFGFVYDDHDQVEHNTRLGNRASVPGYFGQTVWSTASGGPSSDTLFRPIQFVSYHLDRLLFGGTHRGFHSSNIAWHLLTVLLLFTFLLRSGVARFPALMATLLFEVHPSASEVVYWISARVDSLASVFFLLALILLGAKRAWVVLASAVPALLSLLSKETAITLLPSALTVAWNGRRRWTLPALTASVLAYAWLRSGAEARFPAGNLLRTAGQVDWWRLLARYSELLFLPFSPVGFREDVGSLSYRSILALLIGGVFLFLTFRHSRHRRLWLLGLLTLLVPLLLSASLSVVSGFLCDRYLYVPAIGCSICLASAGWDRALPKVLLGLIAATVLLFSSISFLAGSQWNDEASYWSFAARVNERGPQAHRNLGVIHLDAGRPEEARNEFILALKYSRPDDRTRPTHLEALHSLAATEYVLGNRDRSARLYWTLAEIDPSRAGDWNRLAFEASPGSD